MTHSAGEGVSAIWIFANLSFTAMRAQDKGSDFWKVVSFIFGFPGTLLTLLVVEKGCERAYGMDMPRRSLTPEAVGSQTVPSPSSLGPAVSE
jgi:hypothetical protein